MRFAYMDEAGNTGRNLADALQPIHLILTLVIDEARVMAIHDEIREIARCRCPRRCSEPDFEFHGQQLFSGSGPFDGMRPSDRIDLYAEVLRCIGRADARVVVRGVHKPSLAARYPEPFHPHDIAFMFTIESIERMAREQHCRVLLVSDEAREIEDAALCDLANYQEMGTTWGWDPERIDHIIDTIHFVRSETNPAIQLTDCATFLAARQRKSEAGLVKPNAAVTDLWKTYVAPHIYQDAVWYPTL